MSTAVLAVTKSRSLEQLREAVRRNPSAANYAALSQGLREAGKDPEDVEACLKKARRLEAFPRHKKKRTT